ncbi:MAG: VCBS repeat-containing protein [Bacteroidota bacterium]
MKAMKHIMLLVAAMILLSAGISCKKDKKKEMPPKSGIEKELAFIQRKIADSAKFWWSHFPADVTGDGVGDLLFINNNATGGYLGYYTGRKQEGLWRLNIIAKEPPSGGLFASGDLEAADIDNDGDIDLIGIKHPGEWADAGADAEIFWYENQGNIWKPHTIGVAPNAIKDVSFADFDKDGRMDLALLTFEENTLSIFRQKTVDSWERVQFIVNKVLHEGMGVGDLNGDGFPDIVATGMIYYNPGKDIKQPWQEVNLDSQWNDQEGDWSRNGTKTFVRDVDNDGKAEIYMGHSERAGYPLMVYKRRGDTWEGQVIKDSIAACHTLQVFDFDLDGDYDILAGVNRGRAVNLDKTNFEVSLFLNQGDYKTYDEMILETNGIYNGQAMDFDGDGDMDIFRYPDHESKDFYLLENTLKTP